MIKTPDTRYRILNAAINVFSQKGYHDTRVDEIVRAAETSKGGVYFHFPSKQDIFLGLMDEFADLLRNVFWPRSKMKTMALPGWMQP